MAEVSESSEVMRLHRGACDRMAHSLMRTGKAGATDVKIAEATALSMAAIERDNLKIAEDQLRIAQSLERDQSRIAVRRLNDFRSAMAAEAAKFRERQGWHPLEREIADLDDQLAALGVPNTPFVP